jgi:hypothetical protein
MGLFAFLSKRRKVSLKTLLPDEGNHRLYLKALVLADCKRCDVLLHEHLDQDIT